MFRWEYIGEELPPYCSGVFYYMAAPSAYSLLAAYESSDRRCQ